METVEQLKEALKKSEEQIAELHRERRNFLKIVSHDLRSPISRIIGFSDLLRRDLEDEEDLRVFAESIEAAGWNLSKTISRIVEVEYFLMEMRDLELLKTNLIDCISALLFDIRELHPDAHIEVVSPTSTLPDVNLDKLYLDQIVNNLTINACKFSGENPKIKITFELIDSAVVMTVSDKGPGIPKDEQELLFEKFAKMSVQPSNDEPTTGLGLFLVKTCIEAMGGTVDYYTNDDGGASFRVFFPVANSQESKASHTCKP